MQMIRGDDVYVKLVGSNRKLIFGNIFLLKRRERNSR